MRMGFFQAERWHDWDQKAELCQIAMTNRLFYYLILFLWAMSMMQEFRTSERFFRDIASLPPCRDGRAMIEEGKESGRSVVALTTFTRWALYLLVCVPKFLISGYLWWCGAEWLSATTCFQDLVLNTVAMTFVTQIDELLYLALLPNSYQKQVAGVNFLVWEHPDPEKNKRSERRSYRRSATYFVVGTVFQVFLYSNYMQDVLPSEMLGEVKEHCHSYLEQLVPICALSELATDAGMLQCFPYGG